MKVCRLFKLKTVVAQLLTLFAMLVFNKVSAQTDKLGEPQVLNIQTKFKNYGPLLEDAKINSKSISQFNKGQKCLVLSYHGNEIYKIQYKKWHGYVMSKYLVINTEMNNAVKAYKENKNNTVQNANNINKEQAKLEEAGRLQKTTEENAKAEEAARLQKLAEEQAKVEEIARLQKIVEEQAKAEEAARMQKLAEEQAKAEEAARMQKLAEEQAKLEEAARLQKIAEEHAKIEEATRLQKLAEEQAKLEEVTRLQKLAEEQAKLKEAARMQKLAEEQAKVEEVARLQKIAEEQAKLEEAARMQKLAEEQAKAEEAARLQKTAEENAKANAEKERLRYIEERQRLVELKYKNELKKRRVTDSLKRVQDSLDKVTFRKKCHYQMNETDPFYNVKIIRTEKYKINDNVTIELYKNGNKRDVFITYMGDLGCASYLTSNKSYAKIRLENNDVITIFHTWNIDCENFNLRGSLSQSAIVKLKNSPVQSIKLKGTKRSYLVNKIEYKEIFMDKLNCINE
jgi:hypothetical protein